MTRVRPAVVETQLVTGDDLTVDPVWAVALEGAPASLSAEAIERMRAAREVVEAAAADPARTYGVNTGFGRFVTKTIPPQLADELQIRLLRSHACGVGEPYPDEVVRAALLLRGNARRGGRALARVPQSRRSATCAEPGIGRRRR